MDWRKNKEELTKWQAGQTGYPIIDAAMRQLNQTGWMHNRLRMIVASFLTKDLLIDWRQGEAYFARQLIDTTTPAISAAGSGQLRLAPMRFLTFEFSTPLHKGKNSTRMDFYQTICSRTRPVAAKIHP